MTLSYQTKINGNDTYFVEKIIASIHYENKIGFELNEFLGLYYLLDYRTKQDFINTIISYEKKNKKHTIRADKKNRWKVGSKIHSKIWRGKPYNSPAIDFTPLLEVKNIQSFSIMYDTVDNQTLVTVFIDNKVFGSATLVNCKIESYSEHLKNLALNDGFDNVNEFLEYFSEDFYGKIIHWTDFAY